MPAPALPRRRSSGRVESFRHADFEDLVNDTFHLQTGSRREALKLIDAARLPNHPDDARPAHVRQESFSLVFEGQGGELPDAIHRVRHGRFGEFEMSIHQIKLESHPGSHIYEAVFG